MLHKSKRMKSVVRPLNRVPQHLRDASILGLRCFKGAVSTNQRHELPSKVSKCSARSMVPFPAPPHCA